MGKIRCMLIAGAALIGSLASSSGQARAELRVMESTVPGIARDAAFPDGATFDVPAGRRIKFLKKPGNTTHEIVGPYRGSLAHYQAGCSFWDSARGRCGDRNDDVEGGTRGAAPVPGGTRGFSPPRQ